MKRSHLLFFTLIVWTGCSSETTETDIGPLGGTAVSADGLFELTIPPGELSEETSITIRIFRKKEVSGAISHTYELGPKELVLEQPAMAALRTDETRNLVLAEDAQIAPIVLKASLHDHANGVVRAPVWRFSAITALVSALTPEPVLIQGRTLFSDALITAHVGSVPFFFSADSNGAFSIPVVLADPEEVVTLGARGNVLHGEDRLELASVLGPTSAILVRAGTDHVLDESEDPNVVITTLTAGWYAGLYAANSGARPVNDADFEAAEATIEDQLDTGDMYLTSALLRQLISGDEVLDPAYATTLELIEDLPELWRLLDEELQEPASEWHRVGAHPPAAANERVANFSAAELAVHHHGLSVTRRGSVRTGSPGRWEFSANNSGNWQLPNFGWILPDSSFTWSLGQEGLEINFDQPRLSGSAYFTADDVVSLVGDPALEAGIRAELAPYEEFGGIVVSSEQTGSVVQLLRRGATYNWVVERQRTRWRFDQVFTQVSVPAVEILEHGVASTWRSPATLVVEPYTQNDLLGSWLLYVVVASPYGYYFSTEEIGPIAGAPLLTAKIVELASGGIATSDTQTWTWQLETDGSFSFTYPDGAQQSFSRIATSGAFHGILTSYNPPGGREYTAYFPATEVDPNLAISAATLSTTQDQFWVTTMGDLWRTYIPDFGFHLASGGDALRLVADTQEAEWSWEFANDVVSLRRGFDVNGNNRCDGTEPSCVFARERRWVPLATSGDLLIVLEDELWLAKYFELRQGYFDAETNTWIDGMGNPIDLSEKVYLIPPRLNAYRVADMP